MGACTQLSDRKHPKENTAAAPCTAVWLLCVQIKDQEYTTPDNAALVQSVSSRAPVRVFRGKVGEAGERLYVYEGLYLVAAHKREPSKDGPQVRQSANVCNGMHACVLRQGRRGSRAAVRV